MQDAQHADDARAAKERRRRKTEAKRSLRELRVELALLNHRVGARVSLNDADFDCLDVIAQHGPLSPTALARRVDVHLATMTGILNRLERNGWILRERDENDRRAVLVRAVPDRQREIFRLLGGMDTALDEILDDYSPEQLAVIVDFLRRCTEAGNTAAGKVDAES